MESSVETGVKMWLPWDGLVKWEPHDLIQAYCQGPSFLLWVVASHDIRLFLKN